MPCRPPSCNRMVPKIKRRVSPKRTSYLTNLPHMQNHRLPFSGVRPFRPSSAKISPEKGESGIFNMQVKTAGLFLGILKKAGL